MIYFVAKTHSLLLVMLDMLLGSVSRKNDSKQGKAEESLVMINFVCDTNILNTKSKFCTTIDFIMVVIFFSTNERHFGSDLHGHDELIIVVMNFVCT